MNANTIKIKSISKYDFQNGESVVCSKCGAHLRHYAEINGTIFGLDCAVSLGYIGKKMSKSKMKLVNIYVDSFVSAYKNGTATHRDAFNIMMSLGVDIPNSPDFVDVIYAMVAT